MTMQTDLLKQLAFIKEIDKIKYIQRKTKLFYSDRNENDAEHSWHLAMMTLILAEHSNEPIDVLKVVKMVLIHDIVEIDSGDIFIYDTEQDHNNFESELRAANRIFGILPDLQRDIYINLWLEFEKGESKEAKFAKSMDRLEPILQNSTNNGGTWKEYNVPKEKVYDKTNVMKQGSIRLWRYTKTLIDSYFGENQH